jgi:hypothetical protein
MTITINQTYLNTYCIDLYRMWNEPNPMSICIEFILLENTEVNLDQFLACFLIVMEISILYMLFYTYYYEFLSLAMCMCIGDIDFAFFYVFTIGVWNRSDRDIYIYIYNYLLLIIFQGNNGYFDLKGETTMTYMWERYDINSSSLSSQYYGVRTNACWLGAKIMCPREIYPQTSCFS